MQKKINLFVVMLLISTLFFGFMSMPVLASEYTNIVDWEEYNVGASSGSGDFYSWSRSVGNDATVIVHTVNDSTKSLYMHSDSNDATDATMILFNYEDGTTVDNISFWLEFEYRVGYVYKQSNWVVYFYDQNGAQCIKLWFQSYRDGSNCPADYHQNLMWEDANGTDRVIKTYTGCSFPYNLVYHVFINYSYDGAFGSVFEITVQDITNADTYYLTSTYKIWQGSFEYVKGMYQSCTAYDTNCWMTTHLGRIKIEQDGYSGFPEYDVSMWDYIGELERDSFDGLPFMSIEEQFQIEFTGEIKALDLYVHRNQISEIGAYLSYYHLMINGEASGNPVAFIPYQNYYLIRWYWINQTINNTYVTFEFHCVGEDSTNYQNWHIGSSSTDNDGDGNTNYKYGEDNDALFNGLFDQPYTDNYYDLCMRFYYIGDLYDPNYNYPDWIGIKDNPPYYTYVNIPISYTISTKEYDNYMEIWKDGERVGSEQGFGGTGENGKFLSEYSTTIGFVPLESGSYSVNIRRNSINVTAYAFTVLDNPITDYYIYTIPNPSQHPNSFIVHYRYFHGEGKDGILTINPIQDFSNPLSHLYVLYLTANMTGNFSYTPPMFYDLLYLTMGIEISTERYTIASFPNNPYIHYIKDYAVNNYIELRHDIIYLETSNIQTVTGHHNHIGAYIYVQDNGEIIQDVSNKNSFTFSYIVVNSGNHKVELVLSTTNGTVILDTEYFVASTEELPEEKDEFEVLGDYKIWLGVGIVVLCLLLPLAISIKSYVDVPLVVYVAMGSIGTGISVSLGLLEIYWLLLLLVALVTGAVISKWG